MYRKQSIWAEIKRQYAQPGDMIFKLIIVNVAVFLVVNIIKLFCTLFITDPLLYATIYHDYFLKWLAVPSDLGQLIYKPWTLLTYMFLHEGFFHLLFNMLWLYWIGRILQDLIGFKKILPIYLMGGLLGGVIYILSYNLFPGLQAYAAGSILLGASAGVLAIVFAAATLTPDYLIHLILIGPVKLKYIALFTLILDVISIGNLSNAGGHLAHLGGALFGFLYIKQLQNGNDWAKTPNKIIDWTMSLFDKKPKMSYQKSSDKKPKPSVISKSNQARVDDILDKIAEAGYDSLSKEEKDFLFKYSKN